MSNGGELFQSGYGRVIDSHALVMRLNNGPTVGHEVPGAAPRRSREGDPHNHYWLAHYPPPPGPDSAMCVSALVSLRQADVGSRTDIRLTNLQYEGFREGAGREAPVAWKWDLDWKKDDIRDPKALAERIDSLQRKRAFPLNPSFRCARGAGVFVSGAVTLLRRGLADRCPPFL